MTMKRILLFISLLAVVSVEHVEGVLPCRSESRMPKVCTEEGLLCETCSTQINCVGQFRSGQFRYVKERVTQRCKFNEWCSDDPKNRGCVPRSTNPDPYCDGIADQAVRCQQTGHFPHIYHCDRYVTCIREPNGSLRAVVQTCDPGFSYDPSTKSCSSKVVKGGPCEKNYPLARCTTQISGPIIGDDTLYYRCDRSVCVKLVPDLHRCPGNQVWSDGKCSDPPASSNDITGEQNNAAEGVLANLKTF